MSPDNRYTNTVQDLIELIRDIKETLEHPKTATLDRLCGYLDEAFRIYAEMNLIGADDDTRGMSEVLIFDLYSMIERVYGAGAIGDEMKLKIAQLSGKKAA